MLQYKILWAFFSVRRAQATQILSFWKILAIQMIQSTQEILFLLITTSSNDSIRLEKGSNDMLHAS